MLNIADALMRAKSAHDSAAHAFRVRNEESYTGLKTNIATRSTAPQWSQRRQQVLLIRAFLRSHKGRRNCRHNSTDAQGNGQAKINTFRINDGDSLTRIQSALFIFRHLEIRRPKRQNTRNNSVDIPGVEKTPLFLALHASRSAPERNGPRWRPRHD
jgi:hypothetical protein